MTRAPQRGGPDIARALSGLQQQFQEGIDKVTDRLDRVEAKGDARQKVTAEDSARQAAALESMQTDLERTNRRLDEVLASNTRGYRELSKSLDEKLSDTNLRIEAMEVADHAADKAVAGVVRTIDPGVHKSLGYGKLSLGGVTFISVVAVWNWIKVNGHDVIVWTQYVGKAAAAMFKGFAGVPPPPS